MILTFIKMFNLFMMMMIKEDYNLPRANLSFSDPYFFKIISHLVDKEIESSL